MKKKIVLQWSGGKDSVLALYELLHDPQFEVCGLLTTFTKDYDRVSMHGVRHELLLAQARALGQKLIPMYVVKTHTNKEYEQSLLKIMLELKEVGIRSIATGDIFLEDIRRYREEKLRMVDMELLTPLWGRDTNLLVRRFLELGFQAMTVCVSAQHLGAEFVGRKIDEEFLVSLPEGVDPCGERGEFHSFVYDGPLFSCPINFQPGEIVLRDGHYFCDLLPRG